VALNSLKNVAPNVFRESDFMDRSLIPAEQALLFNAFDQLANSVTPYIHLFTDESLSSRHHFLMQMLSNLLNRNPQRQTPFIFFICQHSSIVRDAELGVFRRFDASL
jgi:hypothetical protein